MPDVELDYDIIHIRDGQIIPILLEVLIYASKIKVTLI